MAITILNRLYSMPKLKILFDMILYFFVDVKSTGLATEKENKPVIIVLIN
jgi:hypothetical protein